MSSRWFHLLTPLTLAALNVPNALEGSFVNIAAIPLILVAWLLGVHVAPRERRRLERTNIRLGNELDAFAPERRDRARWN